MSNPWFRLWTDMVNDPKWRTIARVSRQEVSRVISVYLHMMTCASNAEDRGHLQGWCDEDIATALDIDTEDVETIREAMQGRVLDGDLLTGWDKRQPKREDGSADRSRAWRDAKKTETEQLKTQPNAIERNRTLDKSREDKKREDVKPKADATATRLPADWSPSSADIEFCQTERPDLEVSAVAVQFRDYWVAAPGAKGRKADWPATWRNWVRNQRMQPARASPAYQTKQEKTKAFIDELTGASNAPSRDFIDLN